MRTIWNAINPCPRPLRIPCIHHATTWLLMHDGGIFCREEPAFSPSQSSETQTSSSAEIVTETCFPKGACNSLLKEGMLAHYITAAITACIIITDMAIPLTRANRLAAMRDSDERITSIFAHFLRGPLRFTYALADINAGSIVVESVSHEAKKVARIFVF